MAQFARPGGIEKRFTLPTKSHENEYLDNTMQCARVRNRYSDGTSATKGTTATLYEACERLPEEALYALVRVLTSGLGH